MSHHCHILISSSWHCLTNSQIQSFQNFTNFSFQTIFLFYFMNGCYKKNQSKLGICYFRWLVKTWNNVMNNSFIQVHIFFWYQHIKIIVLNVYFLSRHCAAGFFSSHLCPGGIRDWIIKKGLIMFGSSLMEWLETCREPTVCFSKILLETKSAAFLAGLWLLYQWQTTQYHSNKIWPLG